MRRRIWYVVLASALVMVALAGSAERLGRRQKAARAPASVNAGLPVFGPEDSLIAGLPILPNPPVRWAEPPGFDPLKPGLGFEMAPGVEHTVIYDPYPSDANINEGGGGRYESVLHGSFNHHPGWQFFGDYVITQWTNHSYDENGPGQRILSRVGKWVGDKNSPDARIDWGNPYVTTVEVAPPPVPVMRRYWEVNPDTIFPYIEGGIGVRDGRIFVTAHLTCIGGFTTQEALRRPTGPQPPSEFSDVMVRPRQMQPDPMPRAPRNRPVAEFLDSVTQARMPRLLEQRRQQAAMAANSQRADSLRRAWKFRYDFWWNLGMDYVQEWKITNNTIVPAGPMYQITPQLTRVEVVPGRWKIVAPLQPPYTNMTPISRAPKHIRDAFERRDVPTRPVQREQDRRYRNSAHWLAADGKHGLAHNSEFRRPDGKYVSIRDNLLNAGHYYASIRDSAGIYPPAVETNIYGSASPNVGTLPDGRIYILCNSAGRRDMFMLVSRDGKVFDRTWNILHVDRLSDGGIYKGGGPQYYHATIIGPNMWIFYSITKVQMGVTKVPLASL